jgi:predicted  nucleic acid-binding Zn-ribbon protein
MSLQRDENEKKVAYLMDELNSSPHPATSVDQFNSAASSRKQHTTAGVTATGNNNEDSALDEHSYATSQPNTHSSTVNLMRATSGSGGRPIYTSHANFITTKTVTIPAHDNETIYCIEESDSFMNEFPISINNTTSTHVNLNNNNYSSEKSSLFSGQVMSASLPGVDSSSKVALEDKFNQMVDLIVDKLKKEVKKDQELMTAADAVSSPVVAVKVDEISAADVSSPRYEPSNGSSSSKKYETIAQEIFVLLNAQLEQTQREKQSIESNLSSILNELRRNQAEQAAQTSKHEAHTRHLLHELEQARNDKQRMESQLFQILGELKRYQGDHVLHTAKYEAQIRSLSERLDHSNREKAGIEQRLESIFGELRHFQSEITGMNVTKKLLKGFLHRKSKKKFAKKSSLFFVFCKSRKIANPKKISLNCFSNHEFFLFF